MTFYERLISRQTVLLVKLDEVSTNLTKPFAQSLESFRSKSKEIKICLLFRKLLFPQNISPGI